MLRYRNTSVTAKTFYGTTFKPGDEHDVPGYINDPKMIRVPCKLKELPKADKKAPAPSTPKVEESPKSIKEVNKEDKSDGSDNNK